METGKRKLLSNPRQTASIPSILFFGWTIPFFKRSYRKVLDPNDVSEPLVIDQSSSLGDRLERYVKFFGKWNCCQRGIVLVFTEFFSFRTWCDECKKKGKPSLVRAVAKAFWPEISIMGFLCFMNDVVVRLILPFLLEGLLSYFR